MFQRGPGLSVLQRLGMHTLQAGLGFCRHLLLHDSAEVLLPTRNLCNGVQLDRESNVSGELTKKGGTFYVKGVMN